MSFKPSSNPYRSISTQVTPQRQPVPSRTDQVANSAGGYVFKLDPLKQFERFLILGTEGGTYYASEQKLTRENADLVLAIAAGPDALRALGTLVNVSMSGRAPKQHATLFALAILASSPVEEVRQLALHAVGQVCRTATMLFEFTGYLEQFRGSGGRAVKRALGDWYTDKTDNQLALQLIKYRQREGWTHRDLLRLSHPKAETEERARLYDFACGRETEQTNSLIRAYQLVQNPQLSVNAAWELLNETGLPWEALPDRLINEPLVWEAIIDQGIGQTALIRQLPRLTRIGLLQPMSNMTAKVANLISDEARLVGGRVHPISVLMALTTYAQGHSERGSSTWNPNSQIVNALDAAFYASFGAVQPSNKRTLLALDVSGSMQGSRVNGSPFLTAAMAEAAMALVTAATEPFVASMCFSTGFVPFDLSPRRRLDDVVHTMRGMPFMGTDCSLPMLWAKQQKLDIDTFVIYTDNETWAGNIHPFQAVREYRQASGIDARVVVQAFSATDFTIADPSDAGMLDVVGLDAAAPNVVASFSRKEF